MLSQKVVRRNKIRKLYYVPVKALKKGEIILSCYEIMHVGAVGLTLMKKGGVREMRVKYKDSDWLKTGPIQALESAIERMKSVHNNKMGILTRKQSEVTVAMNKSLRAGDTVMELTIMKLDLERDAELGDLPDSVKMLHGWNWKKYPNPLEEDSFVTTLLEDLLEIRKKENTS